MLVLSRKVGERVVIGEGIIVVVKRVSGQRVTFGIEAPHDVKIIRGELEVFQTPPTSRIKDSDFGSPTGGLGPCEAILAGHDVQARPR
jgi:carbon storage regulator CsrA